MLCHSCASRPSPPPPRILLAHLESMRSGDQGASGAPRRQLRAARRLTFDSLSPANHSRVNRMAIHHHFVHLDGGSDGGDCRGQCRGDRQGHIPCGWIRLGLLEDTAVHRTPLGVFLHGNIFSSAMEACAPFTTDQVRQNLRVSYINRSGIVTCKCGQMREALRHRVSAKTVAEPSFGIAFTHRIPGAMKASLCFKT